MSKSTITIDIHLDKEKRPEKITWNSTDHPNKGKDTECKAMLLSLFDKNHLDTFKIDLWTKEMMVNEMDIFVYQSLLAIADTYHRATGNTKLANDMQKFVRYFGEQTKIITLKDD